MMEVFTRNIVEQILMIVFIQLFHIEKGIEKCLLFMNFFLSNKKAIVYLQSRTLLEIQNTIYY